MDATLVQRLRHVHDAGGFRQSQAQVVVARVRMRAGEAAGIPIRLPTEDPQRPGHEIQQQRVGRVRQFAQGAGAEYTTVGIDQHMPAVGHAGSRMFRQCIHQRGERSRLQRVVAIQHAQEFASIGVRGMRECARFGHVTGVGDLHARIAIDSTHRDIACVRIEWAQRGLPIDERLCAQAVQRRGEKRCITTHRHQGLQCRCAHAPSPCGDEASFGRNTWRARTPSASAYLPCRPRRCNARCAASKLARTCRRRLAWEIDSLRMR